MLCVSGESTTLNYPVVFEERRSLPWHYLESTIAVVLIMAVWNLPLVTMAMGPAVRSITIWRAMGFMLDMGTIRAGEGVTLPLVAAFFGLLCLGVGSMADTVFSSLGTVRRGKTIATSWGMVVFGFGMMALVNQLACILPGCVEGMGTLGVGPALWASIVGGFACGLTDLIRSRCA